MIYTEIEKVLRDIIFAKEQEQRQLTQADEEIYQDWQEIKNKVGEYL